MLDSEVVQAFNGAIVLMRTQVRSLGYRHFPNFPKKRRSLSSGGRVFPKKSELCTTIIQLVIFASTNSVLIASGLVVLIPFVMLINEESITDRYRYAYCLTDLVPEASGRYSPTRTTLTVRRFPNAITDVSNQRSTRANIALRIM